MDLPQPSPPARRNKDHIAFRGDVEVRSESRSADGPTALDAGEGAAQESP